MEQTKTAIRSEHRLQTCTTVEKYDTIKQDKKNMRNLDKAVPLHKNKSLLGVEKYNIIAKAKKT